MNMEPIRETVRSYRNTLIPVTRVPADGEADALAVFVHGFKAERTEGGRFLTVALQLAKHGFDSIMMDQCGCGESSEPFDLYSIDTSMDDVEACIRAVLKPSHKRLVLVGYSMGGRVVSAYAALRKPVADTVVLWTAATHPVEEMKLFGTDDNGQPLYNEAMKNGYAVYHNLFDDTYIHLSKKFYEGLVNYDVVKYLSEYQGNVLLCHGDKDDTVLPKFSINVYNSLTTEKAKELVMIWDANHGFGLWDDKMYQSDILTGKTTEFILKNKD